MSSWRCLSQSIWAIKTHWAIKTQHRAPRPRLTRRQPPESLRLTSFTGRYVGRAAAPSIVPRKRGVRAGFPRPEPPRCARVRPPSLTPVPQLDASRARFLRSGPPRGTRGDRPGPTPDPNTVDTHRCGPRMPGPTPPRCSLTNFTRLATLCGSRLRGRAVW